MIFSISKQFFYFKYLSAAGHFAPPRNFNYASANKVVYYASQTTPLAEIFQLPTFELASAIAAKVS